MSHWSEVAEPSYHTRREAERALGLDGVRFVHGVPGNEDKGWMNSALEGLEEELAPICALLVELLPA